MTSIFCHKLSRHVLSHSKHFIYWFYIHCNRGNMGSFFNKFFKAYNETHTILLKQSKEHPQKTP